MLCSFAMDFEMAMWLQDETTSSEITGNLVTEAMDSELIGELSERVFCSDEEFPGAFEKCIESFLDHVSHEVSRFLIMPMSYIWGRRTRKVRHRERLFVK